MPLPTIHLMQLRHRPGLPRRRRRLRVISTTLTLTRMIPPHLPHPHLRRLMLRHGRRIPPLCLTLRRLWVLRHGRRIPCLRLGLPLIRVRLLPRQLRAVRRRVVERRALPRQLRHVVRLRRVHGALALELGAVGRGRALAVEFGRVGVRW